MRRVLPLAILALSACGFDEGLPPQAQLLCQHKEDCPGGLTCREATGTCVSPDAVIDPDPRLVDSTLTPTVAGVADVLRVSVVVEGGLLRPPEVALALPGERRPFSADAEGFSLALRGDEPEGLVDVVVTLHGSNGIVIDAILIGSVRIDRTAPQVITDLSTLALLAPPGALVPVEAVGHGTTVQIAFVPDEVYAGTPVVVARSTGGEELPFLVLPELPGSRVVRAELTLVDSGETPQGAWTIHATLLDEADNGAESEVGLTFHVDTVAPTPLTADQRAHYVFRRARYGDPQADGSARFSVLADAVGAAEPGANLVVFDVDEIAYASVLGVGRARLDGSVPPLLLSRSDRPFVFVAQVDAAGNAEGALANLVGVVDFVVASGGRVIGGSLANPHRFALRGALDENERVDVRELEITAEPLRQADGALLHVAGAIERRLVPPSALQHAAVASDGSRLLGLQATAFVPAAPGRTVEWTDEGLRDRGLAPAFLSTATRPIVVHDAPRDRVVAITGTRPLTTCDYGQYDCCDDYCDDLCCSGATVDAARGPELWVADGAGWRALAMADSEGDGEPGPGVACCAAAALDAPAWLDEPSQRLRLVSTVGVFELDDDGVSGSWRLISGPLPPGGGWAALDAAAGEVLRFDGIRLHSWRVGAPAWTERPTSDPEGDGNPPLAPIFVDGDGALRTFSGSVIWTRTATSWRRSPPLALPPSLPVGAVALPDPMGGGVLVTDAAGAVFRVRGDEVTLAAPRPGPSLAGTADRFATVGAGARRLVIGGRAVEGSATEAVVEWSGAGALPLAPRPELRLLDVGAVFDPTRARVVMFGGATSDGALRGSLRTLDVASGALVERVSAAGDPRARARASLGYAAGLDAVVMFGGQAGDAALLDDTWVLDGSGAWQPLSPAPSAGTAPGPRAGAHFIVDAIDGLTLVGGWDGTWLLERWGFDGTWRRLADDVDDAAQRARLEAAWNAEPAPLPPSVVRTIDEARPPALLVTIDLAATALEPGQLSDVAIEGVADGALELLAWDGSRFVSLKRGALPLIAPSTLISRSDFTLALRPTEPGAPPRLALDALSIRLRHRLVAP